MPAAAVIPAPKAYINVVAVKRLVVKLVAFYYVVVSSTPKTIIKSYPTILHFCS